jgi:hypothetical protein
MQYTTLIPQGVDMVMEVIAKEVGFSGLNELRFYMVADVRVVRASDSECLYEREFVYQSDYYEPAIWAQNQAALLKAELERSYNSLAQSVVEQLFLLTELPQTTLAREEEDFPGGRYACGLAWVSPEHEFHPTLKGTWHRFTRVDSLQPTIEWESFPQDSDRSSEYSAILSKIHNIRYDLRVWKVENNTPPKLVYE